MSTAKYVIVDADGDAFVTSSDEVLRDYMNAWDDGSLACAIVRTEDNHEYAGDGLWDELEEKY